MACKVVVFILTAALSITGCGGGGGGDGGGGDAVNAGVCPLTLEEIQAIDDINDIPPECLPQFPPPGNNLLGRIFVLGTQVDSVSGALRIFANGTFPHGDPMQLADFQAAIVSIDGIPVDPAMVSVDPIAAGDDVLSLAYMTDYSISISDAELDAVASIYSTILDSLIPPNLPQILEGMVINFSNAVEVRQDWTEDTALLQAAFLRDDAFARQQTALFDALGEALQRDLVLDNDGLVERCRPAHMQITFTDGGENASVLYSKEALLPIIDDSKAVMIMLGNLTSDKDLLTELAGDQGAYVYTYSLVGIQSIVEKWAASLSHTVKFTLDPATGFDAGNITIELGDETVTVERPVDGFCESTL